MTVCPVDCIYETDDQVVINPDECIDCALCEPECPVDAIKSEDDIIESQKEFIAINKKFSEIWPNINKCKAAPADADAWKEVKDKKKYLLKS